MSTTSEHNQGTGRGMKLDVNALRYLSREELRTLQAVELGQKNVRCDIAEYPC